MKLCRAFPSLFLLCFLLSCSGAVGTGTDTDSGNGSSDTGADSSDDNSDSGTSGSSDSSDTNSSSSNEDAENSFTVSGDSLEIEDIVNDDTSPSLQDGRYVSGNLNASSGSAYYYGRFLYRAPGSDYHSCGSVRFQLVKNNSTSAYFTNFSLLSLVEIWPDQTTFVSSATDVGVDDEYHSSSNNITIANATSRFMSFDLTFDSDLLTDISNAGVIFTDDFTTMVGGDDSSFIFIAQRATSQPDASISDLDGTWLAARFNVSSSTPVLASFLAVGFETDSDGVYNHFDGVDSQYGAFAGAAALGDADAACYLYVVSDGESGDFDGGFVLSADQSLAVGYDFSTGTYFGMGK